MNVWLVTPCFGRYPVTRLAFSQRASLAGVLADWGITLRHVVVADDANLDIAREHGFDTVEQRNVLGLKVNDGIAYACEQGADWVAFIGSDDWAHPDLFKVLLDLPESRPPVVSGHEIAVVDLERGVLRQLGVRGPDGVSPWLVPRWTLEPSGFRPVDDRLDCGMEGSLRRGLDSRVDWTYHDPHPLAKVDFKGPGNMTPYARITKLLGYGPESPAWPLLAERYPADLVDLARETSQAMLGKLLHAEPIQTSSCRRISADVPIGGTRHRSSSSRLTPVEAGVGRLGSAA